MEDKLIEVAVTGSQMDWEAAPRGWAELCRLMPGTQSTGYDMRLMRIRGTNVCAWHAVLPDDVLSFVGSPFQIKYVPKEHAPRVISEILLELPVPFDENLMINILSDACNRVYGPTSKVQVYKVGDRWSITKSVYKMDCWFSTPLSWSEFVQLRAIIDVQELVNAVNK